MKFRTAVMVAMIVVASSVASVASAQVSPGGIFGNWLGSKGNNDTAGHPFTLHFDISFDQGSTFPEYHEAVFLGDLQVMIAQGTFRIVPDKKPGDPSFQSSITFEPENVLTSGRAPVDNSYPDVSAEDKTLMQLAGLPVDKPVTYYVSASPLNPCGQLTFQNKMGGSSWGLKCEHREEPNPNRFK